MAAVVEGGINFYGGRHGGTCRGSGLGQSQARVWKAEILSEMLVMRMSR